MDPRKLSALELERLAPAEVVVPAGQESLLPPALRPAPMPEEAFRLESCRESLLEHLGVATLEGYGCEHLPLAIRADGALLGYLAENQREARDRLTGISTYSIEGFMILDPQMRRHLELFQGGRWGDTGLCLLSVLDLTKTSMGARLLRRWVGQPLLELSRIQQRLDAVEWFAQDGRRRQQTGQVLGHVSDMERRVNRVLGGRALPREVVAVGRGIG